MYVYLRHDMPVCAILHVCCIYTLVSMCAWCTCVCMHIPYMNKDSLCVYLCVYTCCMCVFMCVWVGVDRCGCGCACACPVHGYLYPKIPAM